MSFYSRIVPQPLPSPEPIGVPEEDFTWEDEKQLSEPLPEPLPTPTPAPTPTPTPTPIILPAPEPTPELNLLYCNANPGKDPCPLCTADVGHVFRRSSAPRVPRHPHCYCYYTFTYRSPTR
jgi:hypothetical protein